MAATLPAAGGFGPFSTSRKYRRRLRTAAKLSSPEEEEERAEIRVCVNRSCSRLGSRETLEVLSGLAPPSVAVASCGCLGRCGAGPNLVVLRPRQAPAAAGHVGTAATAVRLLVEICGPGFDPERNLEALALRRAGEGRMEKGNPSEAESLLSRAIELEPWGGLHLIYKSRSVARLAIGDSSGALEDAEEAARLAPKFPQAIITMRKICYQTFNSSNLLLCVLLSLDKFKAYICQGDAFMAMEEWDAAEKAYSTALLIDPSIRRSKSFKARVAKLQEKLVISSTSS